MKTQTYKKVFKLKQIKILSLILLAITAMCLCTNCSDQHLEMYESMIQAVCTEDYDLAESYMESLPQDYKDAQAITDYMAIVEYFDEDDRDSYSYTLERLGEISSFSDERMSEEYDAFVDKVTSLNKEYEKDKAAALVVSDAIASIGDGSINNIKLSDEESIKKVREDYENCSVNVKELVTNTDYLKDSEQRITKLKEYKKNADEVAEKINKIGEVSLDSGNAISEAEKAYNALSDEAKAYVSNADTLVKAKEELEDLKAKKAEAEAKAKAEAEAKAKAEAEAKAKAEAEAKAKAEAEAKAKAEAEARAEAQAQEAVESDSDSYSYGTVYWVPNGTVYHVTPNCPTLSRSKTIYSGSIPSGRRACKVCS